MYVPLPIIVHITRQKLTENGPLLRAPFVFLGFSCECFGSGFDWDFKHINPPLEVTHSSLLGGGRVVLAGMSCLLTQAPPRDLSLACYSNGQHGIVFPLPRGQSALRQGRLRAGHLQLCRRKWWPEGGDASYLLHTQPLFLLLFSVDFPFSVPNGTSFLPPPNWFLFCSSLWPRFPAWLAKPTMAVAYVIGVFLSALSCG